MSPSLAERAAALVGMRHDGRAHVIGRCEALEATDRSVGVVGDALVASAPVLDLVPGVNNQHVGAVADHGIAGPIDQPFAVGFGVIVPRVEGDEREELLDEGVRVPDLGGGPTCPEVLRNGARVPKQVARLGDVEAAQHVPQRRRDPHLEGSDSGSPPMLAGPC